MAGSCVALKIVSLISLQIDVPKEVLLLQEEASELSERACELDDQQERLACAQEAQEALFRERQDAAEEDLARREHAISERGAAAEQVGVLPI